MATRKLSDEERVANRRASQTKWLANNRQKRLQVQREYNARAKAKRHGYYVATKSRVLAQSKARRARNPELRKQEYARWKASAPPEARWARYLKKYGMTLADYERMFARQGGRCALCGDSPKASKHGHTLDVDHDHDTGAVRALLCRRCNSAVGQVERFESLGLLVAVRTYVAASKALTLVA